MADTEYQVRATRPHSSAIGRAAALILCALLAGTGSGRLLAGTCAESSGKAAVEACEVQLNQDPGDIKVRHALVTALMELGRNQEAVDVLKQGLAIRPGEQSLISRLAEARNALAEQQWIAKQREQQAHPANGATDMQIKLDAIRCSKLQGDAALSACNAGLERQPNDVALLTGKADALLSLNRIPEAIAVYQRALGQASGNAEVQRKLKIAESKRQLAVSMCMKLSGAAGLAACNESILKGAKDQASIEARRGDILVEMKQPAKALDAYRTALKLDRRNVHVKQSIAALSAPRPTESTQILAATQVARADVSIQRDAAPRETTVAVEQVRHTNAPLAQGVTY
ncbi:MAG: tetratricopeptide repeat protein [Gammaproteobacteria bacterium]